jgi:2-polyprenyl-6-methoxyphenol hydroxylase-like FAD-dependent oxidoreductase
MSSFDAVVVGARCAGSVVAGSLAREGWDVLLVDKARFPSDTVSTHVVFPNTIARFEELGIWERLLNRHKVPAIYLRWRILGYELSGSYTAIGGHSTATCIRRIALDDVLVRWAADAGAKTRLDTRVTGLIGDGNDDDPVRGVILEGDEEIRARWVIGADGRASTAANLLDLEKKKPMQGEMAFLFAYWRGLPERDFAMLDVDEDRNACMWNPCEDDWHLVSVAGPPEITRGSTADRERAYAQRLQLFPETISASDLDEAERVSDLVVVPETMMRGFYRRSNGPGWALVGDAGHFKHPSTAQGISDAVEQAVYVAAALSGDDPDLAGFHQWRRDRSEGHYEWSFDYGRWPQPELAHPYLSGLSSDPTATQDWVDTFTRLKNPSDVNTRERLNQWFSTPPTL